MSRTRKRGAQIGVVVLVVVALVGFVFVTGNNDTASDESANEITERPSTPRPNPLLLLS